MLHAVSEKTIEKQLDRVSFPRGEKYSVPGTWVSGKFMRDLWFEFIVTLSSCRARGIL